MSRVIKFRVWNGEQMISPDTIDRHGKARWTENSIPQMTDKVMQFTDLHDKNGKEIYEGDIIQWRQPYRTTQTHRGDNIPNGSYTEPMEPGIRQFDGVVCFNNGAFCVQNYDGPEPCELSWINNKWTLDDIQNAINSDDDIFSDPEDGDLIYLIEEVAGLKNADELIRYLNGVEVIGNIHQNPELL